MINRRDFLTESIAFVASSAVIGTVAEAATPTRASGLKKPNLLFIQPDQFRIQSLGCWSQPGFRDALKTLTDPVHTPALDRLAKESLVFTRATATAAVCSPSRAMTMSGAYPSRNGVSGNCRETSPDGMHDDITCLTDVLQTSGYETALVGKTHWERNLPLFDSAGDYVGTESEPGGHYVNPYDTYIPPGKGRHGNSYWFQTIRDAHYNALAYSSIPDIVGGKKDGEVFHTKGFSAVIEANVVIDYLHNKNGQRDGKKPFSILWDAVPPHSPYSSVKDSEQDVYDEYYKNIPIDKLLNRPNVEAKEAEHSSKTSPADLETAARVYFSLVTSIDRQVGRILQALDESGEAENTIVIFTSDHGEMMGSHGLYAKSVIFDEAFLVPLMIRFPKKLKPGVESLMIGKVDLMPTLLGFSGLKDQIPQSVQGVNYAAELMSNNFAAQPKPVSAAYIMTAEKGIRTNRYTYSVDAEGATQLFDNPADPYQVKNLAPLSIEPVDIRMLKQELGQWLKKANDPWYVSRKYSDLITYPS